MLLRQNRHTHAYTHGAKGWTLGIDPLTVTWTIPTTVSVSVDRLRANSLSFSDEGSGLSQCSLGTNVALALTTAAGRYFSVRGSELTDLVIHDVVSLTRLMLPPAVTPPARNANADPHLRAVNTPEGVPAIVMHPSALWPGVTPRLVALPALPDDTSGWPPATALVPPRGRSTAHETALEEFDDATSVRDFDDATIISMAAERAALNPPATHIARPWAVDATPIQRPHSADPTVTIVDARGSFTYPIAEALYVGREPVAPANASATVHALAFVDSPSGSVSGTHLRLRRHGEHLLARDMWSTNGTTVHPQFAPSFRLGSGEELAVAPGTLLDLGDDVRLTVGGTNAAP